MLRLQRSLVAVLFAVGCARSGSAPVLSTHVIGHCAYTGNFSHLPECKDYVGTWKVEDAQKDCTDQGKTAVFESGTLCAPAESLGACLIAKEPQTRTYIASNDTSKCGSARTGCEVFGGGYWDPSALCGGANDEQVVLDHAFVEYRHLCFTPDAGEAPGHSDGGQVCVWEGIHGSTEEGRSFRNDVNCDNARGLRPYYPKDYNPLYDQPDPRRNDPAYLTEEAWVKSQINASACVCCHASTAPQGASIFDVDRTGSFANQLTDRGLAHGSGLVNSIPLGAFPADVNNGFTKSDLAHPDYSVFPSTDPMRMKAFWQNELDHRGLTAASFVGVPDGFGPLSEQYYYVPTACTGGEAIASDGTITWGNGRARYVYVLDVGTRSPTVYPNLDLPDGTLWRIDLPADGTPVKSGSVKYGVVPDTMKQRFPMAGTPTALVSGKQYYLYVTADQAQPITRCLITAP